MIEVMMGSRLIEAVDDQLPNIEDAANSKDIQWASKFIEEQIDHASAEVRTALRDGKISEAQAKEGYLTALEDVVLLLKEGFIRSIKEREK